jgi:hypothetical protein
MLQVRADPADSIIKKIRRNTCNGLILSEPGFGVI